MGKKNTERLSKVIAKAWTDEEFKQKLLKDPKTVLAEEIADLPADIEVQIHENTDKVVHFILPKKPDNVELDISEIERLASQVISVQLEMFDLM